ncbi:MAG TPA: HDOD domain-containing protein [Azonexus sp.]|nr:HDOD domain-containing protein [Azonexus sp.]
MPSSDFLFIHPLLGADDAWSGFSVEFAPGEASPDALSRLKEAEKLDEFDHRQAWLIPAIPEASAKSRIDERTVVVFPARPATDDAATLMQYEASLRQAHRKIGLSTTPDCKLPATGTWDYLLLTASHARCLPPFAMLGLCSRTVLIATDVHSHADRQWLLDNACTLSTGEFLLSRRTPSAKADTTRVKLLELLALIADDADTGSLEAIFRQEPKLSYSLLRLVNSAAIAPRSPITSFSQAINLLGRRQLQRWLQLLVYADPNNGNQPNPLLQKAAARGHLLELLAPQLKPQLQVDNLADAAFMIGAFSLLNVLLNMSMAEILQQLPLSDLVRSALADHGGALGRLLLAIEAAEGRNLGNAAQRLSELELTSADHLDAQLEAFSWAAKIRPSGN